MGRWRQRRRCPVARWAAAAALLLVLLGDFDFAPQALAQSAEPALAAQAADTGDEPADAMPVVPLPDHLLIAAIDGAQLPEAPRGEAEPERAWRHTFGWERRDPSPASPAASRIEADILIVHRLTDLRRLRRALPPRGFTLAYARGALRAGDDGGVLRGVPVIAVRRSAGVRIVERTFAGATCASVVVQVGPRSVVLVAGEGEEGCAGATPHRGEGAAVIEAQLVALPVRGPSVGEGIRVFLPPRQVASIATAPAVQTTPPPEPAPIAKPPRTWVQWVTSFFDPAPAPSTPPEGPGREPVAAPPPPPAQSDPCHSPGVALPRLQVRGPLSAAVEPAPVVIAGGPCITRIRLPLSQVQP